jgi:CheY-like chemotaxis protein
MVVVDDDSKVRMLLERAFRAPEFETRSFPTGSAALKGIQELQPDCVVSDILMPDMDGEGLLRAIRALPGLERVPFIAVSAVRAESRINAVLAAGASAFLLKPFPLRELIERVRALLSRSAAPSPVPGATGDYTSPTRPIYAAPHTMSTAAVRRPAPPRTAPHGAASPGPAPPGPAPADPRPPGSGLSGASPGRPGARPSTPPPPAHVPVRVAPVRIVVKAPVVVPATPQTPAPPAPPDGRAAPAISRPPVPVPPRTQPPLPPPPMAHPPRPRTQPPLAPPDSAPPTPPVAAPPPPAAPESPAVRRIELRPPDAGFGFGRFTRVDARGRSFIVLTEAVPQPKFTVTTVITEKGVPLRKIECALPHPLAREEDRAVVRRQVDLQHEDTLRRLDDLVLDAAPRRVVWSDQSRSVEAGVLAWAMSSVAQFAETQTGTDETARQLRLTREAAFAEEDSLRAFHVTAFARVVVDPQHAGKVPRRAVRAVAGWCRAFATAALQLEAREIVEPVRQATRRYSLELERMGFYDRLAPRARD